MLRNQFLRNNLVLASEPSGPFDSLHRILFIDRDDVVLFRLRKPHGKPIFVNKTTIVNWFKQKVVHEDEFPLPAYMLPDSEISEVYKRKRDELWEIIKPLVTGQNESIIFSKGDRWRLIKHRAEAVDMTPAYIHRLLQRYWLYGQIPNALMPAYRNCGASGKIRGSSARKRGRTRDVVISGHDPSAIGVNVTNKDLPLIAMSIKVFHLRQGKSLTESREAMIDRYYSEAQIVDGEVVRVPIPNSQLIQIQAYRYWANKLLADTSLQHEVLNESFWRKKMRGRLGRAWQSTIGPTDIFEIDATVGNFYLISEFNRNRLIGRPVIYFVVDRRSSMIVGLHVGLEGPSWDAARFALFCAFTNKVEFCRKYGVDIQEEDWPSQEMCNMLVADNAEMLSKSAERSLQDFLNLDTAINPAGIPVGKGTIESKFFTVLEKVSWTPGAWKARAEDHDRRKDLDMRWDAKLTLRELTQILIEEVLTHNNATRVEDLRTKAMIQANVPPYRRNIYLWGLDNESGERVRHPDPDALHRCLLPSKICSLTDRGLEVEDAYYLPLDQDLETLLASARRKRKRLRVHYDTNSGDKVYVVDDKTLEWSEWRLSGMSSERYASMRLEELLELHASDKFAAHDAADYENQQRAQKRQRQTAIVAKATKEKAEAEPIDSKRKYIKSQAENRANEILATRVLERVSQRKSTQPEPIDRRNNQQNTMVSRRNNVITLLRQRPKKQGN